MRTLALTSVLFLAAVSSAAAQTSDRWLIIPTTSSADDTWLEPTVSKLRTELLEHGVAVWSPNDATLQFHAAGSAPAAEVSEGDIQQWVDQSSKAIRNLAEGDYTTALDQLNKAQALSRSAAEELNREHERAQRMLDTCLYMVRVLLDTSAKSRALTLAQECRQLVPRVEPTAYMHPPEILELLRQVDVSRAEKPRQLRVESDPSGCPVRANGVMLGQTPLELHDLFPGEYRVQVECEPGRRGRVHTADVTTGSTSVFVDLRFDRAVSTQPLLHLRYEGFEAEQQHRVSDAEEVSKAVPARALLLLSKATANVLELELLSGTLLRQRAIARIATGPQGPSRGDIALASRTLLEGECTDFTSAEPVALACKKNETEVSPGTENAPGDGWPAHRPPRGQFIAGLALAGLGSAALITGYVLLVPQATTAEDWVSDVDAGVRVDTTQEKWLNFNTATIVAASVGGAALVAAMPLALPKRDKVPWLAWLSGGVGVGLAAFSIAYGVTAEAKPGTACSSPQINGTDARVCVRRAEQVNVSVLTGSTAAPLLTVPLVYLLRPSEKHAQPHVEVGRTGGYFSVSGQF
jgi:hypothetical protein